jgi:hypothetical protein
MECAPLARRSDPQTSHDAAEKAKHFQARHISIIWDCLVQNGPMTPKEIESWFTGLDYVAIQRRGCDLERRGLIVRGPEVRDGQRVWKAIK